MRPGRHTANKALETRRHSRRGKTLLEHKVEAHKMDAHRLVRMDPAGMLNGIGVNGQLVDLAEQDSVLELSGENFTKDRTSTPVRC